VARCAHVHAQVAAAVADAVGPELTGIRLSPFSEFLDATDPETLDLNLYLVDKLSEMGLLYVHAVEARISGGTDKEGSVESLEPLRKAFKVRALELLNRRPAVMHGWTPAFLKGSQSFHTSVPALKQPYVCLTCIKCSLGM